MGDVLTQTFALGTEQLPQVIITTSSTSSVYEVALNYHDPAQNVLAVRQVFFPLLASTAVEPSCDIITLESKNTRGELIATFHFLSQAQTNAWMTFIFQTVTSLRISVSVGVPADFAH